MENINIKEIEYAENGIVKNLEIKKYIPFKTKAELAEGIIKKILKKDENGVMYIDVIGKELILTMAAVAGYTNIILSDNSLEDYDLIKNSGLMDQIELISGNDFRFFKELIDKMSYEIVGCYNHPNAIIARGMNSMIKTMDSTMEHVNQMIDKGDPNKIAKYLSKGIEIIAKKLPDLSSVDIKSIIEKSINGR